MAEGGEGGSWWGGWVQTAKDKSNEAWSFMKRDLAEFTTVVQKDTSSVVATTATTLKDKLTVDESSGSRMRSGFTNLLMGISETLAPRDYGKDSEEDDIPHRVIFDRAKARLQDIQTDPGTYLNEPDGPPDIYQKWKESYLVDEHKGDISDLLVASDEVRSLYTKLVPSVASHADFWHRYFFKVHQLNKDEARRAALKERAEMTSSTNFDEELGWGDEDDTWEVPDVPKDTVEETTDKPTDPESSDQKELTQSVEAETTDVPAEQMPDESKTEERLTDCKANEVIIDRASKTDTDTAIITEDAAVEQTEVDTQEQTQKESDTVELLEKVKVLDVKDKECTSSEEGSSIEELRFSDEGCKGKEEVEKKVLHLPLQREDFTKDSSGKSSPVQSDNGASKDTSSLSDDWERDFDIEITEQDLKHVAALASTTEDKGEDSDDWENWE